MHCHPLTATTFPSIIGNLWNCKIKRKTLRHQPLDSIDAFLKSCKFCPCQSKMLVGFRSQLYLKLQKNWFIAPYNFGTKCGLSTVRNEFHSLSRKICYQLGRSWHFQVEFLPSFCSLLAPLLTRKKRFSSKTITNLRKAVIQLDYKTRRLRAQFRLIRSFSSKGFFFSKLT